MIVVVGSPLLRFRRSKQEAAGSAVGIGAAAATAGADVELVGKVGEGPAGEVVLLDLAGRGIGHVAVLRDPTRPTPETADLESPAEAKPFQNLDGEQKATDAPDALTLEPADLELALRYLPDYRVVVVADPLSAPSLEVVLAASRWNGAALIILVPQGSEPPADAPEATILEAPETDPDDAFAGVVGAYAAALDRGEEPAEAFATASTATGWSAAAD